MGLRKKLPAMKRPFKVKGIAVGAPVSMVIYVVMLTQLGTDAIVTGVIWCVLGLAIYLGCRLHYGVSAKTDYRIPETDDPSAAEQKKMDREYHIWIGVVVAGIVIIAAMYLVPALML